MDACASLRNDADDDKLFGLYLTIENLTFPLAPIKQKKSVIKYARLPDYDISNKASWPTKAYTLEPRLRRVITIAEPKADTRRSLRSDIVVAPNMASDICKRKIVTIKEDDENNLHPKLSQEMRKSYRNYIHRAIEADIKEEKPSSQRNISRLTPNSKTPKDSKSNVKTNTINNKKGNGDTKLGYKNKYSKRDIEIQDVKNKNYNESLRCNKNVNLSPKLSLSKKIVTSMESEKDISVSKNKLKDGCLYKSSSPKRTASERARSNSKYLTKLYKTTHTNDKSENSKPVSIIHVPLEEKIRTQDAATEITQEILRNTTNKVESCVQVVNNITKDIGTGMPTKVDQFTETDEHNFNNFKCEESNTNKTFDSLDIPNVSLADIKSDIPKEEIVDVLNKKASEVINTNSDKNEKKIIDSHFQSTAYIISRATLTYTTKQKIDFHVVKSNELLQSHLESSPFPLNVVSVFKNEFNKSDSHQNNEVELNKQSDKSQDEVEHSGEMTPINTSYVFDNPKLMKPSDIISTIKFNSNWLQSDYISEQFQRELNFIDSFLESLQYLESCSLSDKCITEKKVESWLNNTGHELKNLEYGSFLTKFENDVDDTKTMASRSLCLLNLLIRDEQRRAKNLLFVLKMREDALKDFTKSQILWLENKKRQENIDISTLKKKQRGALLKLQHECGEMQRMRKALLTLSEKRKLAFMKTKKNIEVKLRNSVDVEQIILGKKKLKRTTSADRTLAPLKCFELSSSGCDDSTTSRPNCNTPVVLLPSMSKNITSAEKCVQTAEFVSSVLTEDQSTEMADENFVVVDGGYLNILFRNLLPQIFSSGKQYEVNKEALKNIVHTSNAPDFNLTNNYAIEEFMDLIKSHGLDRPNTPSTARSLVEEYDKIYKDLAEDDRSIDNCSDFNINSSMEGNEDVIQVNITKESREEATSVQSDDDLDRSFKVTAMDECTCDPAMVNEVNVTKNSETMNKSVSGPLPVPAGAAAVSDDVPPEISNWLTQKASISSIDESSISSKSLSPSISSVTSPVLHEAEELRRQQLAIEREIKALEQQQSQLLAVREIPDKPPPPYTPPIEPRQPKRPRKFIFDDTTEQRVAELLLKPKNSSIDSDPYEIFLNDFCQESIERQKLEKTEKYWDTCNFMPAKPQRDGEKLSKKTTFDIKEVLTSVAPTIVSGVGARRSDHIDDILFAEWRRCEPEWTSLHADEVIVKNQVFESIFQRILTETVDEYKKTVISNTE